MEHPIKSPCLGSFLKTHIHCNHSKPCRHVKELIKTATRITHFTTFNPMAPARKVTSTHRSFSIVILQNVAPPRSYSARKRHWKKRKISRAIIPRKSRYNIFRGRWQVNQSPEPHPLLWITRILVSTPKIHKQSTTTKARTTTRHPSRKSSL